MLHQTVCHCHSYACTRPLNFATQMHHLILIKMDIKALLSRLLWPKVWNNLSSVLAQLQDWLMSLPTAKT